MPYYICITPIDKYQEGDKRTISKKKFANLTETERNCFKPYDSNAPEKTFAEKIVDNIQEDDKDEK